jgi:Bacterial PH domain
MDQLAEDVIRQELGQGEKLLWSGRPRQGVILRGSDGFMIPFSLLWGGFAIFWEVGVIVSGAPWFFSLWGVPFVLVGLYLIFGRFWFDSRQRAATTYGVTSERVVIISGVFRRSVKSLDLDTMTDITLQERSRGGGIINFGTVPPMFAPFAAGGWPWPGMPTLPNFELDGQAREVYEIIRQARRDSKQRA